MRLRWPNRPYQHHQLKAAEDADTAVVVDDNWEAAGIGVEVGSSVKVHSFRKERSFVKVESFAMAGNLVRMGRVVVLGIAVVVVLVRYSMLTAMFVVAVFRPIDTDCNYCRRLVDVLSAHCLAGSKLRLGVQILVAVRVLLVALALHTKCHCCNVAVGAYNSHHHHLYRLANNYQTCLHN